MSSSLPTLSFGSFPSRDGTTFKIWAPTANNIEIHLYDSSNKIRDKSTASFPLKKNDLGIFEGTFKEVKEGALYKVKVDDKPPFPDPTSRFQPEGVHGPSQVVNITSFKWSDQTWINDSQPKLVNKPISIYELHVGTFTPEGTFKAVIPKLQYLKDLGVTVIEIMPIADFPGERNWGYDGVMLYAPARCYGTPQSLMELVNAAHNIGLGVFLDVVYNHFGPDGNYLSCFTPVYFTEKHHTPWGAAVNIDLEAEKKDDANKKSYHSEQVRKFFIENGLYWIDYFHFDGLRMDATHELIDTSNPHFLKDFHASLNKGRRITIIAEDSRNLNTLLESGEGYNFDGVWADDFHHEVRVMLNGDNQGYYADFSGSTQDLADTIKNGWFFCGQKSESSGENRGTKTDRIENMKKFVYCIQNHDQIGNRALGERLNHQISLESYKVASALMLLLPETPMLFQGQEWASTSPFCFFTDHNEELGKLVTAGRRKEFAKFKEFNDPETREKIPDPQASSTFESSKVKWDEISKPKHEGVLKLYKAMLKLRNQEPSLQNCGRGDLEVFAVSPSTVVVVRKGDRPIVGVFHMKKGVETVSLSKIDSLSSKSLSVQLTSLDAEFSADSNSPAPVVSSNKIDFDAPCAVILRA